MNASADTVPRVPIGPIAQDSEKASQGFRLDIEGLRAIAVLAVLAYHFRLIGATGGYIGVDVFFVISGFLITQRLAVRAGSGHGIEFLEFYARRARRIIPLATLVILSTLVVAAVGQNPLTFARSAGADARSAALFISNIRFANLGTSYLSEASAPSLFQQFWSLSVEEQFYLAVPAVLGILWFLGGKRLRISTWTWTLSVLTIGSLAISIRMSTDAPIDAFFLITSRAWEIGVGALCALAAVYVLNRRPIPMWARSVFAVTGLAAITIAVFLFDANTRWPGWAALVPVIGTALVLLAGAPQPLPFIRLTLGNPLPRAIGRYSFALYLWHWPFAVFTNERGNRLSLVAAALFLITCLAVASYHLIEAPIRSSNWLQKRPATSLLFGVALIAVTVVASFATRFAVGPLDAGRRANPTVHTVGALPAATEFVPTNLQPSLKDGLSEVDPNAERNVTCLKLGQCVLGDPLSKRRIVLFGDSHAGHWAPALDRFARRIGFRVDRLSRASCSSIQATPKIAAGSCNAWIEAQRQAIERIHPEVLILSNALVPTSPDSDPLTQRIKSAVSMFTSRSKVIIFSFTPVARENIPECLASHLTAARVCEPPVDSPGIKRNNALLESASLAAGAAFVDVIPIMCSPARCPSINGNVLVYRDEGHLTTKFSASRGADLGLLMKQAVEGIFNPK